MLVNVSYIFFIESVVVFMRAECLVGCNNGRIFRCDRWGLVWI